MEAGLESYLAQLLSVDQDLPGMAARLDHSRFNWRPDPGRWSIGQCIEHLNITTDRYLPVLRTAIADARRQGHTATGPFALSLVERVFLRLIEPPARMRSRTPASFVAPPELDPAPTLERFRERQQALREVITSADGVDLPRIKVPSQFGPVSFSLNGTFAILLAHERRHTWQARRVLQDPAFPGLGV